MISLHSYAARTFYEGPSEELDVLRECLRLPDRNSFWKAQMILKRMGLFRRKLDEEERKKYEQIQEGAQWIKFYDGRSGSFGTGLLPRVKSYLKQKNVLFKIFLHERLPEKLEPIEKFEFEDSVEFREEQVRMTNAALLKERGIIHAATNAGKTEIACAIVAAWRKQTGKIPRTLFIIHRKGLAKQTQRRFRKHLGIDIKMIGGGKTKPGRITIATTQTAANLVKKGGFAFKEFLRRCDILFIDELHTNKASQAKKVAFQCSARMRFGLSGTISKEPVKLMHFESLTGPIIAEVRNKELVELGRSAKPFIRMVEVDAETVIGNYHESYSLGIVHNIYRNACILSEAFRHVDKGRRTLITVGRIKHGKILQALIERKVDIPCEFMSGSTPLHVRDKLKKKFVKGKLPILIASPIFDVGEDLPEIDAWVNAAGGKGWELVLQRLGRTMRRKEGRRNVVFISDFIDKHNKYLFKHSYKRFQHYEGEEVCHLKIITRKRKKTVSLQ